MKYYKGKKVYSGSPYPRVSWPDHPYSHDGQMVYVHRDVAYDKYGELPKGYHVHHIDEDRWNWHPDNLELLPASEHCRLHKERIPEVRECANCRAEVEIRTAKRINQDQVFCALGCFKNSLEKISWPSDEELLHRLEASNFSALARELGVSDNAIRKRLRVRGKL